MAAMAEQQQQMMNQPSSNNNLMMLPPIMGLVSSTVALSSVISTLAQPYLVDQCSLLVAHSDVQKRKDKGGCVSKPPNNETLLRILHFIVGSSKIHRHTLTQY